MSIIQKFKLPILLFGVSMVLNIFGAWAKISHISWADMILTSGLIMQAAAVAWAVYIAFDRKKNGSGADIR